MGRLRQERLPGGRVEREYIPSREEVLKCDDCRKTLNKGETIFVCVQNRLLFCEGCSKEKANPSACLIYQKWNNEEVHNHWRARLVELNAK